jgi:hypothetical protein
MLRRPALSYGKWLLLASGWLSACSGTHEPTQTSPTAHARVAATTNVQALVGMSIDGLHSRLGSMQPQPANLSEPMQAWREASGLAPHDSLATFKTGGLTLIASYKARTRQVHDLLLLGHHEDSLMARAALRTNASTYLVLPVFASNRPNYLLGLRIVATN